MLRQRLAHIGRMRQSAREIQEKGLVAGHGFADEFLRFGVAIRMFAIGGCVQIAMSVSWSESDLTETARRKDWYFGGRSEECKARCKSVVEPVTINGLQLHVTTGILAFDCLGESSQNGDMISSVNANFFLVNNY